MKNLFIGTIWILCLGFMGCVEKNEGELTTTVEQSKFDKLFEKFRLKYPNASIQVYNNNSTEIRESSDCRPDEGGEDCFETVITGFTVDVNGCPVTTGAKVKICEDENGNATLVAFWDFTWSFTSDADCWTFRLDMSDHYVNSRWSDLQNDMEAFYRLLTRNFEKEFLATLILDVPPCGSGYSNIAQFYEDECQLFCAQLGEYNENEFYDIVFTKCGDACCRRITAYCLFNGLPIPQVVQTGIIDECESTTVDCGPGTQVPNVDCNHPCDRL